MHAQDKHATFPVSFSNKRTFACRLPFKLIELWTICNKCHIILREAHTNETPTGILSQMS